MPKAKSVKEALEIFSTAENIASDDNFYTAAKAFLEEGLGIKVDANNRGIPQNGYFDRNAFYHNYINSVRPKIETIMPMEDILSETLKKSKKDDTNIGRYAKIKIFSCVANQKLEREEIANLTRAFNRINSENNPSEQRRNFPVIVLVHENNYLHIATCQRTPLKDRDNQDSIGKSVVLYKIDMKKPLPGHLQILEGMKKSIKNCVTFDALFKKILDSLSIDIMGDKFFKGYKAIYKKIVDYAVKNNKINKEFSSFNDPKKAIRDYVKILMGRIVFIQFLQRKGWMGVPNGDENWKDGDPEFLQNLYNGTSDKDKFIENVLNPLFDDLNSQRDGDLLNKKIREGVKVPYLNGGLFDRDEFYGLKFSLPANLMGEMLEFFRSYNFTIDESAADSVEVGVDPEMLSRIFENLLENNNETGAFYTPKEIVDYMCREALTTYLQNGVEDESLKVMYKKFVADCSTEYFSFEDIKNLDGKLREVKICDPAIGSGAFPMGMLKLLFECRRSIECCMNNGVCSPSSEIKKDIIQNSIYGVDIEKGAVNIARLRFWLALIIDEETPHALPNMDFKIMQGNSLLEQFEGIDLSKLEIIAPKKNKKRGKKQAETSQQKLVLYEEDAIENIQSTISVYYSTDDHKKKEELRANINKNVIDYITHVEGCTNIIKKKIESLGIPNDQFFLWHIYFKEVFDNGGFDIVIGNPPYIELQKMKKMSEVYEKCGFSTYTKSADIYCLFTEHGFNLLKQGGTLCYIMMNKWMKADYGKPLRRYIRNRIIHHIVDYGDIQVFKGATTYPCIILLGNSKPEDTFKAARLRTPDLNEVPYLSDTFKMEDLKDDDNWVLTSENDLLLFKELKKAGFPVLKEWESKKYKSKYGIKTGLTKAFVIPKDVKDKIIRNSPSAAEVIHPFFEGKDIKPYEQSDPKKYLILFRKGDTLKMMDKNDATEEEAWQYICERYPSIGAWLSPHKEDAKERSDQGDFWWELRACSYYNQFDMPKIMYQTFQVKPNFIYDTRKSLCNNSMWIIPTENKALLGLFNSKLGWWLITSYCSPIESGNQLIWDYFSRIPVALANGEKEAEISQYVDKILDNKAKDNDADISSELHEIDCRLYEIYHLTNGEVKVIDPKEQTFGGDFEPYQRKPDFKEVSDEKIDEIFEKLSNRFNQICISLDNPESHFDAEYDLSRSDKPSKEEIEYAFNKWSCAILTAYRGKKKEINELRNGELKERMSNEGLLFRSVDGYYTEVQGGEKTFVNELSFIVTDTDITGEGRIGKDQKKEFFKKMYRLSEHYEQDCFLFTFPGQNRVAFLIATNKDCRDDYRGDIKFAGPLYVGLKDPDNWTGCENGKIAFQLKGMIQKPNRPTRVWIGEGDIFDIDTDPLYKPKYIVVLHDNETKSLARSCKEYQQSHDNLIERVFESDHPTSADVRSRIIESLDSVPEGTSFIGFHCSVSIDGTYDDGARIAFDTVKEWAHNHNNLQKIVIVDIFGDYCKI